MINSQKKMELFISYYLIKIEETENGSGSAAF
jgi:hypothetical protein